MRASPWFPTSRECFRDLAECSTGRLPRRRRAFALSLDQHRKLELLDVHFHPRLPQLLLEQNRELNPLLARACRQKRELQQTPVALAHALRVQSPAKGIQNLTRPREIERNLRQVGVGGRVRANSRSECGKSERVVNAPHELGPIGRHCQSTSELAVSQDRMRTRAVGGIAEIE